MRPLRGRSLAWAGLALAAALAAAALPCAAQEAGRALRASFAVTLAALPKVEGFPELVDPEYVARIPDGPAAQAALDEARWTFGAMAWGMDFRYTPSDRARGIAESFTVAKRWPEGLPAGLKAVAARAEGETLVVDIEYRLDGAAASEMASWARGAAVAQGRGSAAAFAADPSGVSGARPGARVEAATDAARSALREYLREVTHNKPREVSGSFAFASPPRLYLRGGRWHAEVRLYARVGEIRSYGAY